jgi:hypothetical protein
MTNALETFLSSRLPIVGLVAYSIQSPDHVHTTQCFSKSFYPSAAEQMLTGVVQSSRILLPASQCTARYCWIFDCLRAYVAARPDGTCLALLVENNPGAQMPRIQEMLQAFAELSEL